MIFGISCQCVSPKNYGSQNRCGWTWFSDAILRDSLCRKSSLTLTILLDIFATKHEVKWAGVKYSGI